MLGIQAKLGKRFNRVFIDINGSRDAGVLFSCMTKYQKVLRSELLVVNSVHLRRLHHQCNLFSADAGDAVVRQGHQDAATICSAGVGNDPTSKIPTAHDDEEKRKEKGRATTTRLHQDEVHQDGAVQQAHLHGGTKKVARGHSSGH